MYCMFMYIPNGINNVTISIIKERSGITKGWVLMNKLVTDGVLILQLDPMKQTNGYD